jgi:hypothetical protein
MGTVETMGLKKNRGFVWEDVLMSRKWGGIEGDGGETAKMSQITVARINLP